MIRNFDDKHYHDALTCARSHSSLPGSDVVVEVGVEVPGEPLAAPEELDVLGPDGLLEISLKVNSCRSLGKIDDH